MNDTQVIEQYQAALKRKTEIETELAVAKSQLIQANLELETARNDIREKLQMTEDQLPAEITRLEALITEQMAKVHVELAKVA